jgi:hypothetical protein
MGNQIYCNYCGAELKSFPFFYKLGRFVGEDLLCPVCFNEYFKGNIGKDKVRKYDSKTMKEIVVDRETKK